MKIAIWIVVFIIGAGFIFAASGRCVQAKTSPETTMPAGYRNWQLVSVAILGTPFNDIRAKLANALALSAFRKGTVPFPNGAMIARLAWKQVRSDVNDNAFRRDPSAEHLTSAGLQRLLNTSFVAGSPTNVQFMIKDSTKYARTGGWGFFQFTGGKPDRISQISCFACHSPQKATDFVFTRYSP